MSFLCSLPLISSLFTTCLPPFPLATGYVEGEYVLVAPVEIAQVEKVAVRRGDRVKIGQKLVILERRDAEFAVAKATAGLDQAESKLADVSLGRRPEEIAAIKASVASARAQAVETRRELTRQKDMLARGVVAQTSFDQAETRNAVAVAAVNQLEANLAAARLPARADVIKSAEAAVAQARAARQNAVWRLSQRTLTAVSNGTVFDVIRNTGEVAGPQAPVVSILPDGAIKLRLYVPETMISAISVGTDLIVSCDGCRDSIATVSYVSSGPEFTPPVIYSLQNRQKLVYLIEARPGVGNVIQKPDQKPGLKSGLKPGQIVNVDLRYPQQ